MRQPRDRFGRPRSWDRTLGKPLLRGLDRLLARASQLGDAEVLDAALFPWTAAFEGGWRGVRAEAERLCARMDRLPRFQDLSPDQARIAGDDGWRTFFLFGFGRHSERALALCPETARLLARVPGLESACFSILAPGKHIPAHQGITKALLRCHLGLLVPETGPRCAMRVADRLCTWEEGRCLVFDDTAEHEVWNDTASPRVVLLVDFRRPLRTWARPAADALLAALHRSSYVRDALARHAAWERSFAHGLAEPAAAAAGAEPAAAVPAASGPSPESSSSASRASSEGGIAG